MEMIYVFSNFIVIFYHISNKAILFIAQANIVLWCNEIKANIFVVVVCVVSLPSAEDMQWVRLKCHSILTKWNNFRPPEH